jgi:hypothetical protein
MLWVAIPVIATIHHSVEPKMSARGRIGVKTGQPISNQISVVHKYRRVTTCISHIELPGSGPYVPG